MTSARRVCAVCLAIIVTACSTPPPSMPEAAITGAAAPGPGWHQRSSLVLDEAPASNALAAVYSPDGALHVLYREEKTRGWRHSVLSGTHGALQAEPLPDGVFAGQKPPGFLWPNVDLAVDGEGVLHALIDDHHLARRDGAWARENGSPCVAFVRGGPPLRCVGPPADGVPAMRRFDLAILPGGLLVPSWGKVQKLVAYVLKPGGWQMQGVFDAASNRDISLFQGVATANGDIHAVYQRRRDLLGTPDVEWRYEMMPGPDTREAPLPTSAQRGRAASSDDRSWKLACPPPPGSVDINLWGGLGLAVDPMTLRGLVVLIAAGSVCLRTITASGLGDPRIAFSGPPYRRASLVALGEDRFAALLEEQSTPGWISSTPGRTFIATMHDGRWSATEVLGRFAAIATRYGGQAPLVQRRDGSLSLVTLDASSRPVVIDLERAQ